MKRLIFFLISIFGVIIIFFDVTYAVSYGMTGKSTCNKNYLVTDFKISPKKNCLDFSIINNCMSGYNLMVNSTCENKYYLLDYDDNFKEHGQDNILSKNLIDYSIPTKMGIWKRKLVNIDNKNDIITIEGINRTSYIYYLERILILFVVLSLVSYFVYSFNNFNKKYKHNR